MSADDGDRMIRHVAGLHGMPVPDSGVGDGGNATAPEEVSEPVRASGAANDGQSASSPAQAPGSLTSPVAVGRSATPSQAAVPPPIRRIQLYLDGEDATVWQGDDAAFRNDVLDLCARVADAQEALRRKLEMVRRMALYGTGDGTTAEQTLTTIAEYAAKALAASVAVEEPKQTPSQAAGVAGTLQADVALVRLPLDHALRNPTLPYVVADVRAALAALERVAARLRQVDVELTAARESWER